MFTAVTHHTLCTVNRIATVHEKEYYVIHNWRAIGASNSSSKSPAAIGMPEETNHITALGTCGATSIVVTRTCFHKTRSEL
jgi:hypothetical protein